MEKIVIVRNLVKIYEGKVDTVALKGINLELDKGYVYAIYGQSGSGKTTLLNILGGLDKPTQGKIIVGNQDITHLDSKNLAIFRNTKVGFIFQFHYLISEFTIFENIIMPAAIRGGKYSYSQVKNRVVELAKILDIEEILGKYPDYVSGGQRQRAAICRALINEPDIVLADEPTGNLDSENTKIVVDLFFKINKVKGTTFVIVTHNENIANQCYQKIELRDGEIVKIVNNY
ncbi:MAG: ABC transporter ATP-binding protein [Patescibacteria group bacterium]|nr:ABC transporter ATP-binding protein [Patescibacteria group bacterium]